MPDVLPRKDNPPMQREAKAFAKDERGAILILWALFLAVAFGFLALAFDLGRIATTQSQLQSFADQVALAAAGELDGRQDSITRAEEAVFGNGAVGGLIAGQQTYGLGSQALGAQDITLTFYSSLPPDDRADPSPFLTTNPRLARFVRADIDNRTVLTPFAAVNAALNGRTQVSADVGASATAGFTSYACDITPLFFCVPSGWRAENNIGNQILMRSGGGNSSKNSQDDVTDDPNAAWGPGNFGFINPSRLPVDPTGPCAGLPANSARLFRCLVGAERAVTSCIETRSTLPTKTGQIQGLAGAFNTRFDIYLGGIGNLDRNPAYRPAPNVVRGVTTSNGQCAQNNNQLVDSQAIALPRDSNVSTSNRFGNGNWDRQTYINTNHLGNPPLNSGTTRYDMYRAEIAAAGSGAILPQNPGSPNPYESGRPICHRDGAINDPERRVLVAAAVDCNATNPQGQSDVLAVEYVKIFLTEPVGSNGSDFDIWAEVVGTAGGVGSGALNGVYQDFIQLYR
jgi:Flp pilus assembly protein TadG